MAKLLYSKLCTKSFDAFTDHIIKVINKRKDEGFDDVVLDKNFMTGRDPFALDKLSQALEELGYKNNLTQTRPTEFTISW